MTQHERARAIRRDARLSWRERVILCELSDIQGDGDYGWPKLSNVAESLGIDASNLHRTIAKLERSGWLTRAKDDQGRRTIAVFVPVSEQHQNSVKTTPKEVSKQHLPSVKTTRPKVSKQHSDKCQNNTPSFNAQGTPNERPVNGETPPTPRRHSLDYMGKPADDAREALNVALVLAGGTPKARGGYRTQEAWRQVACDADELAQSLGKTVSEVLAVSAAGFVAMKGQGNPEWWAEDVARYFDAGSKGKTRPGSRYAMAPVSEHFEYTTDEELDAVFGPEVGAAE